MTTNSIMSSTSTQNSRSSCGKSIARCRMGVMILFLSVTAGSIPLVSAFSSVQISSGSSSSFQLRHPSWFSSTSKTSVLQSSFVKEDVDSLAGILQPDDRIMNDKDTVTASPKKSYLEDGFVFGLDGSGIERPKGKVSQIVVEGDSLETKPWQRAVVWGTLLGHSGFLAASFLEMLSVNQGNLAWTLLQSLVLLVSSWILADFGSGVLHWSVDNYGNGRTPIMGGIIAAFQGHHSAPWTITERGFENNVYKLCIPFGIVTMAFLSWITGPFTTFFLTVFCVLEIFSQEFHKWSHMTKGETTGWVNQLQELGLTISRIPHAQHHLAPYDGNYCIISGVCNTWLDQSGFFRRLERLVYTLNGVESNAWKLDTELRERTLRGDYSMT